MPLNQDIEPILSFAGDLFVGRPSEVRCEKPRIGRVTTELRGGWGDLHIYKGVLTNSTNTSRPIAEEPTTMKRSFKETLSVVKVERRLPSLALGNIAKWTVAIKSVPELCRQPDRAEDSGPRATKKKKGKTKDYGAREEGHSRRIRQLPVLVHQLT